MEKRLVKEESEEGGSLEEQEESEAEGGRKEAGELREGAWRNGGG